MLGRLLDLLTKDNVVYLDVMLALLLDAAASPSSYNAFWLAFGEKMRGHEPRAFAALAELHSIVADYRRSKRW